MDAPIRLGVIGLGDFGQEHVAAAQVSDHFELVAVADPDPDRVGAALNSGAAREGFADGAVLIASGAVDAISIVAPSATHVALTRAAVESGIAVLVEKPVVVDLAEAAEMLELAERGIVVPAHILRFGQRHSEVYEALSSGGAGRIGSLSARRHRGIDHLERFPTADPILMTMVHDIDQAIWLTGAAAVSVRARSFSLRSSDRIDLVLAAVTDENDRVWDIGSGWLEEGPGAADRLEVYTDRGIHSIDSGPEFDLVDAMSRQLDHFASCILHGQGPTRVTVAEAIHGIAIAEAIRHSAVRGGAEVEVLSHESIKRMAGTAAR